MLIRFLLFLKHTLLQLLDEGWGAVLEVEKELLLECFFLLVSFINVLILIVDGCAEVLHHLELIKAGLDLSFLPS